MRDAAKAEHLRWWHCVLVAALAIGIYSHPKCLRGDFVYDDGGTITGNPVTLELVAPIEGRSESFVSLRVGVARPNNFTVTLIRYVPCKIRSITHRCLSPRSGGGTTGARTTSRRRTRTSRSGPSQVSASDGTTRSRWRRGGACGRSAFTLSTWPCTRPCPCSCSP